MIGKQKMRGLFVVSSFVFGVVQADISRAQGELFRDGTMEIPMGAAIGNEPRATVALPQGNFPAVTEFGVSTKLGKIANISFSDDPSATRSARDVAIYKIISPSVV